jgi:hypothetical protein
MPTPSQLDASGDAIRQVIRAYHGSPYDFNKFDASKIGTGEGAQAYGHGLYFAGNEDTADYYRKALSASMRTPDEDALEIWRRHAESSGNKEKAILSAIAEADDALEEARSSGMKLATERWGDILQGLYNINHRQPLPNRPGHMYEVEIAHPESSLLDYDRPMGQAIASRLTPALHAGLERGVRERLEMGQLKRHADNLRQMLGDPSLAPGELLLHGSADDYGTALAARKLKDAGIPGVRYLDQGSRSEGGGTRNYVMFPGTEDQIRILRKYGLLAPVAAGAASQYNDPQ